VIGSPTSTRASAWLEQVLEDLRLRGYAVAEDALAPPFLEATRAAMYRTRERIMAEVGADRLERAGELGVLRLMLKFDPHFFRFLEVPELLAVVDRTVGETAILHLQNGFILPPIVPESASPDVFQLRFHQDFPRVFGGGLLSLNVLFAIDAFSEENGATLVVPGTHQRPRPPSAEELRGVPVCCAPGAMLIFDSTLWHAAGSNRSGRDRLAVNHQFTRSWIKQQIDYVRALGDTVVQAQSPRTQQLLGWYTRVVTSLDEYYRPEAERLYRKGQG
jgi:ectoine hydroxylase-related dioxygenase (phytanoyl-CoA dioxygenase family)